MFPATVRVTVREMQTIPRVETTFTVFTYIIPLAGPLVNIDQNQHLCQILNLLILQIFIVNFTEKYEPNKLLRSSEDSFYILLQKVKDKKL